MNPILPQKSLLLIAAASLAFGVATVRAQTVTFGFQKGNLTTNSVVLDSGYTVLDGVLGDANATALLTTSQTAVIGSFSRGGSPNGQQNCGFFSYDLTQLANFIAANTSGSSSVSIASASFTVIAAGAASTGGGNYAWALYGTDPFTSSCTWSNYDGVNPWTAPAYQSLPPPNDSVQYGYTGGGTAPSTYPLLNTNSIYLNGVSSGNPLTLRGGTNFISAISNALARTDRTLYLTLRIPAFVNADSRQALTFSGTNTVASRPLLQIVVNVTVTAGSSAWTGGGGDNSWTTAGNWSPSGVPPANSFINFNNLSTANLSTVLNQDFTVNGISVTNPAGPVTIAGPNSLSINSASGIDLSAATQDLTVTAPVVLGANQTWNVGASQTLSIGGAVSGSGNLTITGAGKVSLGASNVLPTGAGAGSVTLSGTLDLNGTAQTVNQLTGNGVVDNTAVGAATLTLTNGSGASFNGTIQNTGGALALAKFGAGNTTLNGANTYSGGTTINAGILQPGNANAIGTGMLTVNSNSLFYPVAGMHITNAVTLNGGGLEIGGGNNNVLSMDGPITVTADSALKTDGGAYGVYVNGGINMGSGNYTLISFNNNSGKGNQLADVTGANGTIINTGIGTLWITGTNSYAGTFRASNGPVAFQNVYAAQNATLDMNALDSGNVSFGADVILGALTGSRDVNLGVRSVSIGNNNASTTYSGAMSNSGSVTKIGSGTLTLSGANTYSGDTTNTSGTLLINGSVAGNVEVLSGATLGGYGSIGGSVNVQAGGTLALTQDNTVTNLAVGGDLTLAGDTVIKLSKDVSPSSDVLNVTGNLNYSGTLIITNVGATALAVGDSFQVFKSGGTGTFTVQGNAGAGKGFQFNDGVISVVSTGPSGPTLTSVSPNPVMGSSYAVTLTLTGTGFTPSSTVLLTNGASSVSATTTFVSSTTLTASFIPGTTASAALNATVLDGGNYSSPQTFSVTAPPAVSINQNAVNSAGAGKLVLSGTGGTAGNSYAVVSTTSLTPPVVWTPIVTNQFDGFGGFSYTNVVSPTTPKLFLRISE